MSYTKGLFQRTVVGCGPPVPEILQHPEEGKENAWVAPAQGMGGSSTGHGFVEPTGEKAKGESSCYFQ